MKEGAGEQHFAQAEEGQGAADASLQRSVATLEQSVATLSHAWPKATFYLLDPAQPGLQMQHIPTSRSGGWYNSVQEAGEKGKQKGAGVAMRDGLLLALVGGQGA